MIARSAKQILKAIGCDKLDLARGPDGGYWYFIYDDVVTGVYETKSIYCCYLNQMTVEQWAEDGKGFVAEMEAKRDEVPNYKNMSMIFKNMEK